MSVVAVKNAAGDLSIGVEVDGSFITFQTLTAARVAQLAEHDRNLRALADDGNAAAADRIGAPLKAPATRSSSKAKGGDE